MTQPPDPELLGVRALVTGGTSGLGFAMSQALAEAGARVALTGRTGERVHDAATRIAHGTAGLVMDVRDEHSVAAGVDHALATLGGLCVPPGSTRPSWDRPSSGSPPAPPTAAPTRASSRRNSQPTRRPD